MARIARVVVLGACYVGHRTPPHGPEKGELLEPQEYARQIKELLAGGMKNVDELIIELNKRQA